MHTKPIKWWLLTPLLLALLVSGALPTRVSAQGLCGPRYTVAWGDTLSGIAARCQTTVNTILALNPQVTNRNRIYPGQVLQMPFQPTPTPPPPPATVYIVRPGDTLTWIAARHNTTVAAILGLNPNIRNQNLIYVGQVLRIFQPQPPSGGVTFTQANIHLIALEDNGRSGKRIGCNDSLIPVRITFAPTRAPLTAALQRLLAIKDRMYGQSGLYNALYQSNLRLQSATIQGGHATIHLSGVLVLGGVCDNPRVREQLEATALQFSTVTSVSVFINGVPLSQLLSGQ